MLGERAVGGAYGDGHVINILVAGSKTYTAYNSINKAQPTKDFSVSSANCNQENLNFPKIPAARKIFSSWKFCFQPVVLYNIQFFKHDLSHKPSAFFIFYILEPGYFCDVFEPGNGNGWLNFVWGKVLFVDIGELEENILGLFSRILR